jgi:hypothetical protein
MASTSVDSQHFHVGSVSSVYSIRDAIESCQCPQRGHLFHCLMPLLVPDRRSQIMCSTARVVSSPSCSGPTLHAGDPRPAHDEENLISPRPNTRTPQEALASDLDWDEDELAISAHSSFQQNGHTYNENDDEAQPTASRIHTHMPVDERTQLLPSMTNEAPRSTSPRHPQNSMPMPIKSTTIGQSTFRQTVSHRVFPFLTSPSHLVHLMPRPAFQRHRIIAWYWHAFGASCVLLCGVDLWNTTHGLLWLHHVLHVCSF